MSVKYWGATYSTDAWNFGEITSIFVVPEDWEGYRHHGYCWCPLELVPID